MSQLAVPISASSALSIIEALVVPYVPDTRQPVIWQAARQVLRQFCRDTLCWQERLSTTTTADEDEYSLDGLITTGDGHVLQVITEGDHDADYRGVILNGGAPLLHSEYLVTQNRVLVLDNAPSDDDLTLTVDVAIMPARDWETIPEALITLYAEGLAAGVEARLLGHQGAGPQSTMASARYRNAVADAKLELTTYRKNWAGARPL